MTAADRLVRTLRRIERRAEKTQRTLAAIAARRLIATDVIVVVSTQQLFDNLIAQLRDIKHVSADLVAQLSRKGKETT